MANPYVALAEQFLELGNNVFDMLPDYEQRKNEKWHKLGRDFDEERKKPRDDRNDVYLDNLADELVRYGQNFSAILKAQNSVPVHPKTN